MMSVAMGPANRIQESVSFARVFLVSLPAVALYIRPVKMESGSDSSASKVSWPVRWCVIVPVYSASCGYSDGLDGWIFFLAYCICHGLTGRLVG